MRDRDLVKRFERECEIALRIRHPHIVAVHDFATGADGGTPFIAMAYITGKNLAEILERGSLPPDRAAAVVMQVASALHAAHGAGLRHRDVKPHNIMIEVIGADHYHAWLIDWGIAQPIDAHGVDPVTRTGVFVGTPDYIAPERLRSGVTADDRADIYSLAVVLHECLAGRPPFRGDLYAVLAAHLERDPEPLPPSVPAALRAVVSKGLEKDPDDRHQTARDFGDAVARAVRRSTTASTGRRDGASSR